MTIFQEKSIGNGLGYVRGLQVMLIDVDTINQTEAHKWLRHIKKNTHGTFFKRIRLGMVSDMSEASKPCSSKSTTSTRPTPKIWYFIFSKTHLVHVYIQFTKRNRLGMVSDMATKSHSTVRFVLVQDDNFS